MDRKVKWRTFWLAVLTLLSILMLVPTVVATDQLPPWFARIFNRKIQLGLDLEGGLHIVYGIDLEKAVADKATEIKRDLEAKLEELKIPARVTTPSEPPGAVSVIAEKPEDRARIDQSLFTDYGDDIVRRDCPAGADQPSSVCVRVSSDYADSIKKSALEQAVRTVRERIDERGIAEPNVVAKDDEIIVELPGLDKASTDRVKDLIGKAAKLEFKIVVESSDYMKKLYAHVVDEVERTHGIDPANEAQVARVREEGLTTAGGVGYDIDQWDHEESGRRYNDWYLTAKNKQVEFTKADARKRGWRGCQSEDKAIGGKVKCTVTGREIIEEYLANLTAADPSFKLDDEHVLAFEEIKPAPDATKDRDPIWRTYYVAKAVELAGSAVSASRVIWNPESNRPEVLVEFNRWGGRRFGELTGKAVGRRMAIILDDKVASAPTIRQKLDGGSCTITMGGGDAAGIEREAQDLVNVLRTGSLPAPLKVDKESEVGPLLGHDAIEKTRLSFLLGAVLVFLIMVYFYRRAGVISLFALVLNVLYMLALMAGLGATLTLPGIAALVLTLGMAVDANIVIYERARDELRHGKSIKGAVDAGFKRGFAAVLDGHLTTAAAGLVLYQYGSGPIKGFAVMLMIGIATTLFTAVWATRLFFDYYLRRNPTVISI